MQLPTGWRFEPDAGGQDKEFLEVVRGESKLPTTIPRCQIVGGPSLPGRFDLTRLLRLAT